MRDWPRADQFSGCLIGQCLGDALGFPVEGYVPEVCRQYVLGILRTGRAGEVGRHPFPFGQYTDDSQLARELLLSYRESRRFDPAGFASRVAALFAVGEAVGGGRATAEAARRLAGGVRWEEAGTPPPSAGNGSAMRAAPIGLLFHDDPEGLVRAASDQGRITHRDSRCSAGAVAVAGAVAASLRPGPVVPWFFLGFLGELTKDVDGPFTESLSRLEEWLGLPPFEAALRIGAAGQEGERVRRGGGITPFVTGSVLWSLYCFLRSPDDYWETVCTAIAAGGDTDTTAAMAGAVSGARLGLEGLPPLLAMKVNDRGRWGYEELVDLAEACFAVKGAEGAFPDGGEP